MSTWMRAASYALLAASLHMAPATPAEAQLLTLAEAVDSALASNPTIGGALARQRAALESADVARAAWWPGLSLNASLDQFQEPMITRPIHGFDPEGIPDFDETLVQGSLGLRYTLFDGGGRSSAIDGADSEADAARAAVRVASDDLIVSVSEAYLTLLSARALDDAAQARIVALESELDRVTLGLQAGTNAEVEVLRASVALQDAQAQRIASQGSVRLAVRELARVMGEEEDRIAGATLAEPATLSILGAEAPTRDAPMGSPAVTRAEHRVEAARARVDGQRALRFPSLDLHGAVLDYGTLNADHVVEWRAGVSLSWPLFTGGARSAAIRHSEAALMAAEHERDAVALSVEGAVDRARTAVESADARVLALEASVEQWTELVRIETLALDAGAGMQRDLLDAEAGLFRARATLTQSRANAALARVQLAAALGRLDRTWIERFSGGTQ